MRGLLLIILLILTTAPVVADTGSLRAIVSSSNAPPYALFDESGDLAGGISKDILEALARASLDASEDSAKASSDMRRVDAICY